MRAELRLGFDTRLRRYSPRGGCLLGSVAPQYTRGVAVTDKLRAPGGESLKIGLFLLVILMIPGFIASSIGGQAASMAVGIAAGSGLALGSVLDLRRSVGLVVLLGVVAAAGVLAAGQPIAAALVVAAVTAFTGLTNGWSAGSYALAPVLAIVFAATDRGLPWWSAAAWSIAGGLIGLVVLRLMKVDSEPSPMSERHAWRHAIALAAACGVTLWAALAWELPQGYWIPVTLLVALRPLPEERSDILADRLWGTVIGAVVALVAAFLLPPSLTQLVALVFLGLVAGYGVARNYLMQTACLTPMLMLFATAGDDLRTFEFTAQRVLFTILGVIIGAAVITALAIWDARDTEDGAAVLEG